MNVARSIDIETPRGFALAILVFLVVVTLFGFATGTPTASGSVRMLDAAKYSGVTLFAGLVVGFTAWGLIRMIRGPADAPEVWETVMLLVTLLGVISVALRMFP